ncbi:GDSL-type esterase/lipase family protein [Kitasatospora sp. NPDC059646]|uniref:GDSL-type esterase/lipase family protein n=1 Tax=Kitasatospora sp. NPDC059646 TaxID=3346893 RepID=UPI0036B37FC0
MARNIFGGTAADVAETVDGARVPGAVGTVWDGPSDGARQLLDLQSADGGPITQLVADSRGFVAPFLGPDGVERVWVDFGAGRVALLSGSTGEHLAAHLVAPDPHGTAASVQAMRGVPNGFAGLDQAGQVPVQQLPTDGRYAPAGATGVYVPPGWGQHWRAKRDAAQAGKGTAVVAAVGSSSTQGLYSGDLLTDSYVSRIRTSLQESFGDGGSGFFAASRSLTFFGASPTSNAWNSLPGNLVQTTGTWSNGNVFGPGAQYISTTANGATAAFKVRGTTIRVYTMSGGGRVGFTYAVDGGTAVPVADSGTPSIQVTTITGLPAGNHTVTLAHNGAAGSSLAVCGVSGENSSGVIVNNFGVSGAQTGTFAAPTAETYQPTTWNGGPDYPCDLLIYALGANDASAGIAIDTYTANLRKFLSTVKDGKSVSGAKASGDTDILILMQHIGNYDHTTTPRWHDYCDRARGIAEAYGAAFVSLWPMGRNSWNNWNSLGFWGNAATPGGGPGADPIHMSNAGHEFTANAILPILTS